jgi:hypothetical protein
LTGGCFPEGIKTRRYRGGNTKTAFSFLTRCRRDARREWRLENVDHTNGERQLTFIICSGSLDRRRHLPSVLFETESARTPSDALRLYCAICEDWAETVPAGGDRSECYPIRAAPTREHAEMLLGRIGFIREKMVPDA